MSVVRHIGKFSPSSTALFLCDMQVKFRPNITKFEAVVQNSNKVLHAAQIMSVPTFATEQYPKGLGHTVPELELEKYNITPHSKTCFTMMIPELVEQMKNANAETKSVILCGIETQACITATTLDLLEMGLDVHIPVDCVSSRNNFDRKVALERLKQSGAFLTSCEAVILGMAPDAAHPKFRGIQKLVMEMSLDTGLDL